MQIKKGYSARIQSSRKREISLGFAPGIGASIIDCQLI